MVDEHYPFWYENGRASQEFEMGDTELKRDSENREYSEHNERQTKKQGLAIISAMCVSFLLVSGGHRIILHSVQFNFIKNTSPSDQQITIRMPHSTWLHAVRQPLIQVNFGSSVRH